MGTVNVLANGTLFMDFRFRGKRCKEYTKLKDGPANRKKLKKILERIEAEITLGTFTYGEYFPNSKRAAEFARDLERVEVVQSGLPCFRDFGESWFGQMKVEWRDSYANTVRITLDKYLLPEFGDRPLTAITKDDLLNFRADIASRKGNTLSPECINHIMTPLRMILNEAAQRYSPPPRATPETR
jgi:integrase